MRQVLVSPARGLILNNFRSDMDSLSLITCDDKKQFIFAGDATPDKLCAFSLPLTGTVSQTPVAGSMQLRCFQLDSVPTTLYLAKDDTNPAWSVQLARPKAALKAKAKAKAAAAPQEQVEEANVKASVKTSRVIFKYEAPRNCTQVPEDDDLGSATQPNKKIARKVSVVSLSIAVHSLELVADFSQNHVGKVLVRSE